MKKLFVLLICILLTSCSTVMSSEITNDKFQEELPDNEFDKYKYILLIEESLSEIDYIRIDSIFLEDSVSNDYLVNDDVIENILSIYNSYSKNHSTYEIINFLDMHVKKISKLDLDILLLKVVNKIEESYIEYENIVNDDEFKFIVNDYTNRITETFLENYELDNEAITLYPHLVEYINKLRFIINGGYQIRRFDGEYQIIPDYASILVRYEDYYSEEANLFVDILVRESRTVVKAGDIIQIDNDEIAYKINQLEIFMNTYKNSMYYEIVRNIYFEYFHYIVENNENTEFVAAITEKYKASTLIDFKEIISWYGNTEMARILSFFVDEIESNNGLYNEELIDDIKKKIMESY